MLLDDNICFTGKKSGFDSVSSWMHSYSCEPQHPPKGNMPCIYTSQYGVISLVIFPLYRKNYTLNTFFNFLFLMGFEFQRKPLHGCMKRLYK